MVNTFSILAGLVCWVSAAFLWGTVPGLVVLGAVLIGGPICTTAMIGRADIPTEVKPNG